MSSPKFYRHITLLFPKPDAPFTADFDTEEPHKKSTYKKLTREGFIRTVERCGGTGVIPLASFVSGQAFEVEGLEEADLADHATFVVDMKDVPLGEQERLQQLHDEPVEPLCKKKVVAADGTHKEFDGVAIGRTTALLVEAKTKLSASAAFELLDKEDFILKNAIPEFVDKQIKLVLCGNTMPTNKKDMRELERICQISGIEIWLPSGQNIGIGDSCSPSPVEYSLEPGSRGVQAGGSSSGGSGANGGNGGSSSGPVSAAAATSTTRPRGLFLPGRLCMTSVHMRVRMPPRRWLLQQGVSAGLGPTAPRGSWRRVAF